MRLITLNLPDSYIADLDRLVRDRFYSNRAEAIRAAVKDMLTDELWEKPSEGRIEA